MDIVPTAMPLMRSMARPVRIDRVRAAVRLPLIGAASGAVLVALTASTGRLTWPVLVAAALWPLVLLCTSGRPPAAGSLRSHHSRGVARAVAVAALVQWVLSLWIEADPRTLLATVATLALATIALAALVEARRRRAGVPPRALVIGEPADLRVVMPRVAAAARRELDVVGGCTPEELAATLDRTHPELVVVVPSARLSGRELQRLTWQAERGPGGAGLPVLVVNGLQDVCAERARPLGIGGLGMTEIAGGRRSGPAAAVKVAWERAAAAVGLVLLLPVLLALVILVRLDSPGPALFRQTRVGRDGRPFTMLKLRTMRAGAEAARDDLESEYDQVLFKVRHDPRVTGLGRVLRRYSLDELPQLINVVRGEMSLVGPRPALPAEVAAYDLDPHRRLKVRPGLTGLWQVSGRSDLSWQETVRLDLDYVDNWSLRRDLGIVARTVRAVATHRGAY